MINIQTHSPEETIDLGKKIGRQAGSGAVIALTGDLGSGKTALTQGIAGGIGIAEKYVASPSYTLINHYSGRGPDLYHVDLYRLTDRQEAEGLGLDEVLHRQDVVVIEWAEKFGPSFWREDLEIRLAITGETERKIVLTSHGPTGERIISALLNDD